MANPQRRVTPEQTIGSVGQKQFAGHMEQSVGWQSRELSPDLGEDFIVDVYDRGVSAGLAFYAQLKSSPRLSGYKLKRDNAYSYKVDVNDLLHWRDYLPPVVLVLWDTTNRCGYWTLIADVLTRLEKDVPDWEKQESVKVRVPADNQTDADGLKCLRHAIAGAMWPALREGKQMTMTLSFSFPDDEGGRAQREGLERHRTTGEAVTLNGQYLTEIVLPDWYERKFGSVEPPMSAQFTLDPTHSEEVEQLRLSLLSSQKRVLMAQTVEAKATRIGEEQLTFSNEHRPAPLFIRLTIRQSGHILLTFSLHGTRSTASEALLGYKFFQAARQSVAMRVDVLTRPDAWGSWRHMEIPIESEALPELSDIYGDILRQLDLIERKTGVSFALTDEGIRAQDWDLIGEVARILDTGRLEEEFEKLMLTMSGSKGGDGWRATVDSLLNSHRRGEPISCKGDSDFNQAEILGVNLPLGPLHFEITGQLDDECAQALEAQLNALGEDESLEELSFTLIKGRNIREYSDWLSGDRVA